MVGARRRPKNKLGDLTQKVRGQTPRGCLPVQCVKGWCLWVGEGERERLNRKMRPPGLVPIFV